MKLDTGLTETARQAITEQLSLLLADTYTLYLKTQGYHWNVTGPLFPQLHLMFEQQYVELRDAADEIAERMRALGANAPAGLSEYSELTSVTDGGGVPEALDMVARLAEGHEAVARTARKTVEVAEPEGDIATADLATQRVSVHEKTAWMLRATSS